MLYHAILFQKWQSEIIQYIITEMLRVTFLMEKNPSWTVLSMNTTLPWSHILQGGWKRERELNWLDWGEFAFLHASLLTLLNIRKDFSFLTVYLHSWPLSKQCLEKRKKNLSICNSMVPLPATFTGILSLSCNLIHRPVCFTVHKASIYQDFLASVISAPICIHFIILRLMVICKGG